MQHPEGGGKTLPYDIWPNALSAQCLSVLRRLILDIQHCRSGLHSEIPKATVGLCDAMDDASLWR